MLAPRPKGSAMPAERLPMRQVREVLRLKYLCGQSGHRIAAAIGISRYTVAEYLRRAAVVGITWPVPPELDDTALERKLFTPPGAMAAETVRPQPDWVRIHAEMRRPGVTLLLLWEEYRTGLPEGYGYSRFCDLYAAWRGRLSPTMRQSHPLGERLFVDYAGQTVEVIDAITGEVRRAQIFVAALGASNLTYAEARWTQGLSDWIGCHVNAFAFLGGVTRQVVCDNSRRASPQPAATSPASTAAMPTWRRTTGPPSCQRGCANHATRQRSRLRFSSCNVGSWPGCGIAGSSRWSS